MKDSHVHTNLSHDGISDITDYIKNGSAMGVDEITFTEHWDDYTGLETSFTAVDIKAYREKYLALKDDSIIKTNFGIELGLQPHIVGLINTITKSFPFDFIIGSSHITRHKEVNDLFDGITREEAYRLYFEEMLENIKVHDGFDVYGHIDYIIRYDKERDRITDHTLFAEFSDEILRTLIQKGKGIEINTSGYRYGLGKPHPDIYIVERYRKLGGELITVGSDAHKVSDLAFNFDLAYDMLESAGFKYVAVYHDRKPELIPITSLRKR